MITDDLWKASRLTRGCPGADDRWCLEGSVYVLRTGVPWHLFRDRQFGVRQEHLLQPIQRVEPSRRLCRRSSHAAGSAGPVRPGRRRTNATRNYGRPLRAEQLARPSRPWVTPRANKEAIAQIQLTHGGEAPFLQAWIACCVRGARHFFFVDYFRLLRTLVSYVRTSSSQSSPVGVPDWAQ